jgi:ATP-binding protein involved in chromosome partitioning
VVARRFGASALRGPREWNGLAPVFVSDAPRRAVNVLANGLSVRLHQGIVVPITREQVLKAVGPIEIGGQTLAQSGRMSEIAIDGGRVSFAISIDPAEAAGVEPSRAAAEAVVRTLPGVTACFVSLTADKAGGAAPAAQPPGRRAGGPPRVQAIPGVRHVVAVASGKGGVGKSTLACNLALALKAKGLQVGLLDADIYGPSAPKLFGLGGQKPRVISGRILEPIDGYGVRVMSIGFLVEEEAAMIWRGPMIMSAITADAARGRLGRARRASSWTCRPARATPSSRWRKSTPLAGAVIVSTPQDLALIDARRGVAMFRKVEVPILGIVENMASFACPHCGEVSHIFGQGGARREAERLGVPFLGEVPLHMAIARCRMQGGPWWRSSRTARMPARSRRWRQASGARSNPARVRASLRGS